MSQKNLRKRAAPELELDDGKKAHLDKQVEAPFTNKNVLEEFLKNFYAKIDRESANGGNGPVVQSLKKTANELNAVTIDQENEMFHARLSFDILKQIEETQSELVKTMTDSTRLLNEKKELLIEKNNECEKIITQKDSIIKLLEGISESHNNCIEMGEQILKNHEKCFNISNQAVLDTQRTMDRRRARSRELVQSARPGMAIRAWQQCLRCDRTYSEELEATPRVLDCGHTFCHTCITQCIKDTIVECPCDKEETIVTDVEELRINRLVLFN